MKHFIWIFTCLLVVGCGGVDDRPVRVPVRGVVTVDGKPLEKGYVCFRPTDGQRQAQGAIQKDGTYELTTFDKGDGAVVGEHTVTILSSTTHNNMKPNEYVEWHFPQEYSDTTGSNIKRTVEAGEANVIDFESNGL